MIFTVTFNPAIDYVVRTGEIVPGSVNRAKGEEIFFGGKGINVSLVLKELGIKSKALGFVAGFTGYAIQEGILERGIETDFVYLGNGFSRINVKIKTDHSEGETELNGRGPDISMEEIKELLAKIDTLQSGDTLVLAGSVPGSLPHNIYEQILAQLDGRGIRAVVDASGELLINVLKYKPFLVKPNQRELGELFKTELKTDSEIIEHANLLRQMGAQNVLVSMAGDGAILVDERGEVYRCKACSGTVLNSVGAGDSMLAGFLAGCAADCGYDYALKLGSAAGGATAFSTGLATKPEIFALLEQLESK